MIPMFRRFSSMVREVGGETTPRRDRLLWKKRQLAGLADTRLAAPAARARDTYLDSRGFARFNVLGDITPAKGEHRRGGSGDKGCASDDFRGRSGSASLYYKKR